MSLTAKRGDVHGEIAGPPSHGLGQCAQSAPGIVGEKPARRRIGFEDGPAGPEDEGGSFDRLKGSVERGESAKEGAGLSFSERMSSHRTGAAVEGERLSALRER